MQQSIDVLERVSFLSGTAEIAAQLKDVPAMIPFDDRIVGFLNDVSKEIMSDTESRAFSDVITFAFWIRKGSVLQMKERFDRKEALRLGRGVVFHVAPSNVPVNFAFSLAAGLLNGNANVVRVPSKDYSQVSIIVSALNRALEKHPDMRPYVLCVRYERDKSINDFFSSVSDVRVVWGGDRTIAELRESPLPPRSGEITFADRYSLAVIDSDAYLNTEDKAGIAKAFYNDTFLSDQNACTSPRIVVWEGKRIPEAKELFWKLEYDLVARDYRFQPIQAVNKMTTACLVAAAKPGVIVRKHPDNLIIRISVPELTEDLMEYRDNSGYFYEYDCEDIMEIAPLCRDKRCQTIVRIGDAKTFLPLIQAGIRGVDRIVPVGKSMDFDLLWDGYDLSSQLTRSIVLL